MSSFVCAHKAFYISGNVIFFLVFCNIIMNYLTQICNHFAFMFCEIYCSPLLVIFCLLLMLMVIQKLGLVPNAFVSQKGVYVLAI